VETLAKEAIEFEPVITALSDLRGRTVFRQDSVRRIGDALLAALVADRLDRGLGTPVIELTARHPFADNGWIDVYQPGRWDCESDAVYLSSIVQVGPSPGEWDGSVCYARFTATAAGTYIVVVNFTGYQQTMSLNGPWGTTTAHTATTSDAGTTTALWTANAGDTLFCTFSSRSDSGYAGLSFLDSFQVFTAD
jgi:hypothetical protein